MADQPATVDPVWEAKYAAGHAERYPWDSVVSFVYRNMPRDRARHDVGVVEVGCGTGSNLWFAAREGFRVCGLDASASAIAAARSRFGQDALDGRFEVGSFLQLPFASAAFDLAIDRAAITCVGLKDAARAVDEVRRVLRPGGRFFFNPYSDRHRSACSGQPGADGLRLGITEGSLVGAGQICFYGRGHVEALFARGWRLLSLEHLERTELLEGAPLAHCEWRVIAEKLA